MLKGKTHQMVGVSLFGAVSFVLMFLAFPILPAFPYLKVDFSDLPILLSFLLYGPAGGILSAFIRTFLHYIQTGGDMGYPIGDFASFIASLAYCWPVFLLLKRPKTKAQMLFAFIAGITSLTAVLSLANWYIITPLYLKLLNLDVGNLKEYILAGVVPFNLIKGTIISFAFLLILPKLQPWLIRQSKWSS